MKLEERKANLEAELVQLQANIYALQGAIQLCTIMLAEEANTVPEPRINPPKNRAQRRKMQFKPAKTNDVPETQDDASTASSPVPV